MPSSFQALPVHHFSHYRRSEFGDSEIVVKEDVRENENEKELCCFINRFSGLRSLSWVLEGFCGMTALERD
jgi:hypothetical protein